MAQALVKIQLLNPYLDKVEPSILSQVNSNTNFSNNFNNSSYIKSKIKSKCLDNLLWEVSDERHQEVQLVVILRIARIATTLEMEGALHKLTRKEAPIHPVYIKSNFRSKLIKKLNKWVVV